MAMESELGVDAATIAAFCKRWNIRQLALFGSAARGELRPDSDIDVMIRFEQESTWDLFDLGTMQSELSDMFARDVDLVEHGTISNPFRRASIERDLTVLYAA